MPTPMSRGSRMHQNSSTSARKSGRNINAMPDSGSKVGDQAEKEREEHEPRVDREENFLRARGAQ